MTNDTPSEGNGRGLPEHKVQDLHDELVALAGLSIGLDHSIFACGIERRKDTPHEAIIPLVQTLTARLNTLSRQLDRHLSGFEEHTT